MDNYFDGIPIGMFPLPLLPVLHSILASNSNVYKIFVRGLISLFALLFSLPIFFTFEADESGHKRSRPLCLLMLITVLRISSCQLESSGEKKTNSIASTEEPEG